MTVASQRELMLLQIQMTEVMTQNAQLMAKIKMRQMKRRQKAKEKAEEKRREAEEKRRKKKRSVWVRKWLQRRPRLGQYTKLINELKSVSVYLAVLARLFVTSFEWITIRSLKYSIVSRVV